MSPPASSVRSLPGRKGRRQRLDVLPGLHRQRRPGTDRRRRRHLRPVVGGVAPAVGRRLVDHRAGRRKPQRAPRVDDAAARRGQRQRAPGRHRPGVDDIAPRRHAQIAAGGEARTTAPRRLRLRQIKLRHQDRLGAQMRLRSASGGLTRRSGLGTSRGTYHTMFDDNAATCACVSSTPTCKPSDPAASRYTPQRAAGTVQAKEGTSSGVLHVIAKVRVQCLQTETVLAPSLEDSVIARGYPVT